MIKNLKRNLLISLLFVLLAFSFTSFVSFSSTKNVKADNATDISISNIEYLGLENNNPVIGLYRVTLTSAMEGVANTTAATPRGAVQLENGTAVADIRGEGTDNTLIIRMLYGLVKANTTSITDIEKGTKVVLKAGVPFTLNNGKYQFSEDVELIYEGGSNFVKNIPATDISISNIEYLGLENGNAAIGLYRVTLTSAMEATIANTVFASPRGAVQLENGTAVADIKGDNTDNSLVIRMLYGLIKTEATSISNIETGTKVVLKAGVPFTINNTKYQFTEDIVLDYNGGTSFVKYVEPTEIGVQGITYLGIDGTDAFGLYRISLDNDLPSNVDLVFANNNFILKTETGTSAGDIRGEKANNSLIARIPYARIKEGATSITDLGEGTKIKIDSSVIFNLDGQTLKFKEDINLALYSDNIFHIKEEISSSTEISVEKIEFLRIMDNPLSFDYKIYLTDDVISNDDYSNCYNEFNNSKRVLVSSDDNSFVGYLLSTENSDCLLARIYVSTLNDATKVDEIPDAFKVIIKGGNYLTFDKENYFTFEKDIEFIYNKDTELFCPIMKNDQNNYLIYDDNTENWIKLEPTFVFELNGVPIEGEEVRVGVGKNINILKGYIVDVASSKKEITLSLPTEAYSDDVFVLGEYQLTVCGTDILGIFADKQYTLIVCDDVPPTISVSDFTLEYNQGDEIVFTATVSDNYDNLQSSDIKVLIDETALDEYGKLLPGEWKVKLFAKDSDNNIGYSDEYTITVKDTEKPTVVISGELNYEAGTEYLSNSILSLQVDITDNFDQSVEISSVEIEDGAVVSGKLQIGQWVLTVYAQDLAGNVGEASITITVADTVKPVIVISKSNKIEYVVGEEPNFTISAVDSYEGAVDVVFNYPEGCLIDGKFTLGNGEWQITAIAKDSSNNEESVGFKVFISESADTEAPVIQIVSSKTDYKEGEELEIIALANDNKDGNVLVEFIKPVGMEVDGKLISGNWKVVLRAIDSAGNVKEEQINITVSKIVTDNSSGSISTAVYIGIACGVVVLLAVILIVVFVKKKNKR